MRWIQAGADVDRILSAPSAVLCVLYDWWDGFRASEAVLEEWERSLAHGSSPEIYLVDPHEPPFYCAVLERVTWTQLPSTGCGSAMWIRSGRAVDFEPDLAEAGVSRLLEKTRNAFRGRGD
jgi:hypothetical protein